MTKLANGPEMILPLLGIEGLPKHLISFELRCKADGLVEIQCEFHIEQSQLLAIEESWKPVLAEYVLVRKDQAESIELIGTEGAPKVPVALAEIDQPATENVAKGVANV